MNKYERMLDNARKAKHRKGSIARHFIAGAVLGAIVLLAAESWAEPTPPPPPSNVSIQVVWFHWPLIWWVNLDSGSVG